MRHLFAVITGATATPTPETGIDNSNVQPGSWYGIILIFLVVALIVLIRSLNKHLKRVNFDETDES